MKKIFYILVILSLAVISCKKTPDPARADFEMQVSGDPEVGKEISFINKSQNAVSFDWDFGDGYASQDENPFYTYNSTGTFTVRLTVKGENGDESSATLTVDVKIPTLLVVEVVEYYDEYVVPGAEVRLYESLVDWNAANDKWVYLGLTDDSGISVFSNLGPYVYYVDAYKGYNTPSGYDNYTLAEEDQDFITVPTVIPNKINWFTAWVDVADHSGTKGSSRSREFTVKRLERRSEKEVMHKLGTDGWKELYEKSLRK